MNPKRTGINHTMFSLVMFSYFGIINGVNPIPIAWPRTCDIVIRAVDKALSFSPNQCWEAWNNKCVLIFELFNVNIFYTRIFKTFISRAINLTFDAPPTVLTKPALEIAEPSTTIENCALPFGNVSFHTYGKELMQHNPPPEIYSTIWKFSERLPSLNKICH